MSLLLASKTNKKWLKNCKNQRMLEKRRCTQFRGLKVDKIKPKLHEMVFEENMFRRSFSSLSVL